MTKLINFYRPGRQRINSYYYIYLNIPFFDQPGQTNIYV